MTTFRFLFAAAFVLGLSGGAVAQQGWPTLGDLIDHGQDFTSAALGDLVDGKTIMLSLPPFGTIVSCEGEASPVINYDSGFSDTDTDSCEIVDSSICIGASDRKECFFVRKLPANNRLFFGFEMEDAAGEDEIDDMREMDAFVLAILPMDIRLLQNPVGEIDFGPVAFTLPEEAGFVLRDGNGFPLGLAFGELSYGGFRVNTEILGWPELLALPVNRSPEPGELDLAKAHLGNWEYGYRTRDLGGYAGSTYRLDHYEATRLELPGGHCVRIREDIGVEQSAEGFQIKPDQTAYFRQACIVPSAGSFFLVTTALNDPQDPDAIAGFEALSRTILDSLRLGFATQD